MATKQPTPTPLGPKPVLPATSPPPIYRGPAISGLGPEGRLAERARQVAATHRQMYPASEIARILTLIIDELADGIDRLMHERDRLQPLDRIEMGVDEEGRKTIVVRYRDATEAQED